MEKNESSSFEFQRRLASLLAKEYAENFLTLLVMYRDISASEAASRLDLHIKTAQDFLEGLAEAGILTKREAAEGKRPYFRYALKETAIHLTFHLETLYNPKLHSPAAGWKIKERKHSGALFKEGRSDTISSVHVFKGSGRSRHEKRYSLTERQGKFLFHLPFPTEEPLSVSDIMDRAGLEQHSLPEILDLVDILTSHGVIEKVHK